MGIRWGREGREEEGGERWREVERVGLIYMLSDVGG